MKKTQLNRDSRVPLMQQIFTETMKSPTFAESLESSQPKRNPVHQIQDSSTASSSESDQQQKVNKEQCIADFNCLLLRIK